MLTTLRCSQLPAMVCNSLLIFLMYMVQKWDIKFNPLKSQVINFGSQNPCCQIMLNSNQIPWVNKVKYLGVHFCCNTGITDLSDICRKFYGQFNSILSVLGKCWNEMAAVHLTKTYCLPTLMYGCETWTLTDNSLHTISVALTTVFGVFLSVAGVTALNLFSFSAKHCQLRT